MESEQFFLKWNNFENNLTSGFADLLKQELMVDVTLAAEGKIIQAHKIILSICSSYFRNMFRVSSKFMMTFNKCSTDFSPLPLPSPSESCAS